MAIKKFVCDRGHEKMTEVMVDTYDRGLLIKDNARSSGTCRKTYFERKGPLKNPGKK